MQIDFTVKFQTDIDGTEINVAFDGGLEALEKAVQNAAQEAFNAWCFKHKLGRYGKEN